MARKAMLTKTIQARVFEDGQQWTVEFGELRRHQANPGKTPHLFRVIGEKLPHQSFSAVKKHLTDYLAEQGILNCNGVYIAHDSMGFPRYIGRGNIFNRLKSRFDAQKLELVYFSFYVIADKKHEREIETLLIRAAGGLLEFNNRKKRVGILQGNIKDYEAGTRFYERQYKRGR
jgi:hypothetical protein